MRPRIRQQSAKNARRILYCHHSATRRNSTLPDSMRSQVQIFPFKRDQFKTLKCKSSRLKKSQKGGISGEYFFFAFHLPILNK